MDLVDVLDTHAKEAELLFTFVAPPLEENAMKVVLEILINQLNTLILCRWQVSHDVSKQV